MLHTTLLYIHYQCSYNKFSYTYTILLHYFTIQHSHTQYTSTLLLSPYNILIHNVRYYLDIHLHKLVRKPHTPCQTIPTEIQFLPNSEKYLVLGGSLIHHLCYDMSGLYKNSKDHLSVLYTLCPSHSVLYSPVQNTPSLMLSYEYLKPITAHNSTGLLPQYLRLQCSWYCPTSPCYCCCL